MGWNDSRVSPAWHGLPWAEVPYEYPLLAWDLSSKSPSGHVSTIAPSAAHLQLSPQPPASSHLSPWASSSPWWLQVFTNKLELGCHRLTCPASVLARHVLLPLVPQVAGLSCDTAQSSSWPLPAHVPTTGPATETLPCMSHTTSKAESLSSVLYWCFDKCIFSFKIGGHGRKVSGNQILC